MCASVRMLLFVSGDVLSRVMSEKKTRKGQE